MYRRFNTSLRKSAITVCFETAEIAFQTDSSSSSPPPPPSSSSSFSSSSSPLTSSPNSYASGCLDLFHFTLNLGNHDSVVHMVRLLCRKVGAFTCPQHDPQENTSPEETLTYLHAPNVIRTHDPTFCMIEGSTHRRCRCLSLALLRSYRQ